uniref:Uncharacterized protein n=1 Tax=Arion vulgaris TaxID=1028688 RepID=A0A0B6YZL7_9EUPU
MRDSYKVASMSCVTPGSPFVVFLSWGRLSCGTGNEIKVTSCKEGSRLPGEN